MIPLADELDEQLKIKVEAITFKHQPIKAIPAKNFEHGKGIAQPLPKQDIDERGKKPVAKINKQAQAMLSGKLPHFPDIVSAMPGTECERRAPGDQRFQQSIVILQVVFQVGV